MLWEGHPAWSEYSFLWFFSSIFGIRAALALWMGQRGVGIVFGIGVILFVGLAVCLRQRSYYKVTRQEVQKSKGIFGKNELVISLNKIDEVEIRQGPMDRLFGIGTMLLFLKEGKLEQLVGIKNPEILERKIKALL